MPFPTFRVYARPRVSVADPYTRVVMNGVEVDRHTAAALLVAERRLGYNLTITQGSYNGGGVAASGGTHDGGGVVDLAAWDHTSKVLVLRSLGFAAWYRSPAEGPWPPHIHAVLVGNRRLAPSAARQVTAYRNGYNGLANNAPDTGPRVRTRAFRYRWWLLRHRWLRRALADLPRA